MRVNLTVALKLEISISSHLFSATSSLNMEKILQVIVGVDIHLGFISVDSFSSPKTTNMSGIYLTKLITKPI